jgi:hypothetical protein
MSTLPPPGVALDDEATRAALGRYRLKAWGWLVCGLVVTYPLWLLIEAEGHHHYERLVGRLIGLTLVAFVAGAVMLVRASRWKRVLANRPWTAYQVHYLPRTRSSGEGLVLSSITRPDDPRITLIISTVRWRIGRLRNEPSVWACGDPTQMVVASPVSRELFAARAPHGRLGRKWARAHRAELDTLGIELPEEPKRERRHSPAVAFLVSAIAAVLVFFMIGLVGATATGPHHGTAAWITVAAFGLLTLWMVKVAITSWLRAQ